ncbi:MAG: GNAT family N-acetyltransferase [Hydrococcus sp. Prado102]|jgi:ribosomal protein S18 acetylase RimI-like enzyme|nr:GNAT family N-acetyltransferase [Hydrococcus sp. Prado102]
MTFHIRHAVPRDCPKGSAKGDRKILVNFMTQLQEFERTLHPNRSDGRLIGSDHLAYLERLAIEQNGCILVAESLGELLGFLVCFVEEIDAGDKHIIEQECRFGYISDLYVLPKSRGQGIATALIQQAEVHFKALGLSTVRITFLHNNYLAQKFYEDIGYQPYEIIYEKRLCDR